MARSAASTAATGQSLGTTARYATAGARWLARPAGAATARHAAAAWHAAAARRAATAWYAAATRDAAAGRMARSAASSPTAEPLGPTAGHAADAATTGGRWLARPAGMPQPRAPGGLPGRGFLRNSRTRKRAPEPQTPSGWPGGMQQPPAPWPGQPVMGQPGMPPATGLPPVLRRPACNRRAIRSRRLPRCRNRRQARECRRLFSRRSIPQRVRGSQVNRLVRFRKDRPAHRDRRREPHPAAPRFRRRRVARNDHNRLQRNRSRPVSVHRCRQVRHRHRQPSPTQRGRRRSDLRNPRHRPLRLYRQANRPIRAVRRRPSCGPLRSRRGKPQGVRVACLRRKRPSASCPVAGV